MTKYSQNYILERQNNLTLTGLAQAGVAFLIFASAFLWLFL